MVIYLEDGTKKMLLNMTSKNGKPELVSLLQYMRDTRLDNPEVTVKDERIVRLDEIVTEVKQSEEWEAVRMNLIEIGEKRRFVMRRSIIVIRSIGSYIVSNVCSEQLLNILRVNYFEEY